MNRLPLAALLLAAAAPLAAQKNPPPPPPRTPALPTPPAPAMPSTVWHTRYDRPGTADTAMRFDSRGGDWLITTSPRGSGVAWKPSQTALGNFTAELESSILPGAPNHLEGYGMILGGRDLDGPNQTYLYFLIRKDGAYLIKHRAGDATHSLVEWTTSAAIAKVEGDSRANNTLTVRARADSVIFLINNQRVHALARSDAPVDGIVGLRVNHGMTVNVARLDVRPQGR